MPVRYDISPALNLLIYICTDSLTGVTFFKTADQVPNDPRFKKEMKMIIDIFSAEIDTSLADLHLAIEKNKKVKQSGWELGKTAVVTKSTSLKFLADALKMMSPEAPSNFGIFNNKRDAIRWLGYSEQEKEVSEFWDSLKTCQSEKKVPPIPIVKSP